MNVPGSDKYLSNLISSIWGATRRSFAALLPAECFLCGAEGDIDVLCAACIAVLPRWQAARACPVCALPDTGGGRCARCVGAPPAFDATIALFDYAFPIDRLVHALKYQAALDLAGWLGGRLAASAGDGWDTLLAVPLHRDRLRERGFNQSLELARPLAKSGALSIHRQVLRRRATPSQAGLAAPARRLNLRAAFKVDMDLAGRRVLAVDDVMTTGATLDALATALKGAGADRVVNLVVARTPPAA